MKRWLVLVSLAALLGAAAFAATSNPPRHTGAVVVPTRAESGSLIKLLTSRYSKQELASGTYVGSEYCLACHTTLTPEVAAWRDTKHASMLRKPMGMYTLQPRWGVMANMLGGAQDDFMMGLDFNTLSGTPFDSLKPNAPILSYDAAADRYYIQLGPSGIKLWVVSTQYGQSVGNGQRYHVRVPVTDTPTGYSNGLYFAPFAWSGTGYSSNASSWYTGNTPKYAPGVASSALVPLQGQNYLKTCAGCHITGVRSNGVTPQGEYVTHPYPATLVPDNSPDYPDLDGDGIPDIAGIGCESCHGPGSMHILGGGDPTKIVNPADITNNQQRSITCLQCHVQIDSAPNKTWGYTFDETDNTGFKMTNPPDDISKYQISKAVKWPDGFNYEYARLDMFRSSAHFQGSHGIACNDCHNAHAENTTNDYQVRDSITRGGVTYANTKVDDDSFCMSCHHAPYFLPSVTGAMVQAWKAAGPEAPIPDNIRDAIESHTHHPYGAANPDGSDRTLGIGRCVTCHMAPGQGHTFFPAKPEDTIKYAASVGPQNGYTGNVNSCSASCHRGRVIIWPDVPANLTYTDTKYGTANEVGLANHLVTYFGPGGAWWDTAASAAPSSAPKP